MTAATVPAEAVAEVLRLVADLVAEPRITRAAARIESDSAVTPHAAHQAAMANAAVGVRAMLAGLLSPSAGAVTVDGLAWAAAWLRRELDEEDGR